MIDRYELLERVMNNCEIKLGGNIISKEIILQVESKFLQEDMKKDGHSASMFLHTGSICYDAVAFVLLVLANLLLDKSNATETIDKLVEGSYVTYEKSIYTYLGPYNGAEKVFMGRHGLMDSKGVKKYISAKDLHKILPYNGTIYTTNRKLSKGSTKRIEFLQKIAGLDNVDLSSISKVSTVIYMDHSELDFLLNEIELYFPDTGLSYKILDLETVTFYTATREIKKSGNTGNNEPAIKVTHLMDKARELVIEGGENDVIGFASFGATALSKAASEFEALFKRRRLQYSLLITKLEYHEWILAVLEGNNINCNILALSSKVLNSVEFRQIKNNYYTERLYREITIASNRTVKGIKIESNITWKIYKKVKEQLLYVMQNCLDDKNVIQFCRWGYSILKLYNNAFFTMQEYEDFNYKNERESLESIINSQEKLISSFSILVRDRAEEILLIIKQLYYDLYSHNEKKDYIKQHIFENKYKNMLFVVPAGPYMALFDEYAKNNLRFRSFRYKVITEAKLKSFDVTSYDCVAFMSLLNYERVNPLTLLTAQNTEIYLYDSQIRWYYSISNSYRNYLKNLNLRNPFELVDDVVQEVDALYSENDIETSLIIEENSIDQNLQAEFLQSFLDMERQGYSSDFSGRTQHEKGMEAYRYGRFITGENILFSKGYIAYVFDPEKESVVEKKIDDVLSGEYLVFTIHDNKTRDIVDELLEDLCDRNDEIKEAYRLVCEWKSEFREFKNHWNYKFPDIVRLFKNEGLKITSSTINQWISEDSHIVGPAKREYFIYIGKVLSDDYIEHNYTLFADATERIRSIRRRILKLIQNVAVSELNGTQYNIDELFATTIEKIRDISDIKQLEIISDIDEKFYVQVNRINRPLEN